MKIHLFDMNIGLIIRRYARKFLNTFLCILYGFWKYDIPIIMVTGTDGKSTTVAMITSVLKAAKKKVASFSTVEFVINDEVIPNTYKKTTSDVKDLKNLLNKAKKANCDIVVLEVSSHSIWYNRIFGLKPLISVFTNISAEHLDFHGNIENYVSVKSHIFKKSKFGNVINIADDYAQYFTKVGIKNIGYHLSNEQIKYYLDEMILFKSHILSDNEDGLLFDLEIYDKSKQNIKETFTYNMPINGDFNVKNAMCAIAVGYLLNIDYLDIRLGLQRFNGLKGRMQKIYDDEFKVYIDFTVTPQSYEIVLSNLNKIKKNGRLIVLMGSCGDRDKSKRPKIGQIACKYADIIILTNEDPYNEDPISIIQMIESGISTDKIPKLSNIDENISNGYCVILDREQAIKKAISIAKEGDILLFAGKGGETKMMIKNQAIDWDEEMIIKKYLQQKDKNI